ncbi:MAG: hypothetical protein M3457_00260, partial [Chloroflexota bacterium]|nr:hypothetical protein [Chloroflexota bacterium]
MTRLILACLFLLGMMGTVTGMASARQTETNVDIAAISETVLEAGPEALAAGLETPPDDAILPEGFINPPSGVSENAEIIEQFTGVVGGINNIEGATSNVSHAFETDPAIVPGLFSTGIITYVVTDAAIDAGVVDEYEMNALQRVGTATPASGAESGATPSAVAPESSVQRIDINGTEAVLATVNIGLGGVSAILQNVAVPVGNTLVIGTVLVADQGEVDREQVLAFAEALTLAGVEHLGTV